MMDALINVNTLRSAVTLLGLILFIGLMAWTWWPRRKSVYEAAALLPIDDGMAGPCSNKDLA